MEAAPEALAGWCGHPPCLCRPEPGRRFCCLACARGGEGDEDCRCGHFGCGGRS